MFPDFRWLSLEHHPRLETQDLGYTAGCLAATTYCIVEGRDPNMVKYPLMPLSIEHVFWKLTIPRLFGRRRKFIYTYLGRASTLDNELAHYK